ncbi:DNA binding protein [Quillaja saponaria]|uniref:DNA binding protein n=1 Tax=Quillaja saponaria TaxID=32244 RepID=A0AAD7PWK6_QUISA|nr:DNA binding protein [Quillaja saponaria]
MHAIKGGWVGQTFALAKCNESEGRKTRIRRSKEERKAMVESFIKKYQKLNKGSFPSLNLTHKEVGGSFYTVREIVRDIIQENRVLGPAKFDLEEEGTDQFLKHDPLGSIAIEPQTSLSTSINETHLVPSNLQATNGDMSLVFDAHSTANGNQLIDGGHIINGTQVDVGNHQSSEPINMDLQEIEPSSEKNNLEKELVAPRPTVTPVTEEVIVETFPLRPVTSTTECLEEGLGEVWDSSMISEKQEIKDVEMEKRNECSKLDDVKSTEIFSLADEEVNDVSSLLLEKGSGLKKEEADKNLGDPFLESSKQATPEESTGHKTLEQSHTITEVEVMSVPNGIAKNLNSTNTGSSSTDLKTREETPQNVNESEVQLSGSSQLKSNPTLDRINLESWEGASKTSVKPENNPLLAIFKALVDAFVKFWSE